MVLDIPAAQKAQVEFRLASDIIAWLTTVRPSGMPDTVPVWYVQKYEPRIRRLGYGDPTAFAANFSVPVIVTPTSQTRCPVRPSSHHQSVRPMARDPRTTRTGERLLTRHSAAAPIGNRPAVEIAR